MRYLIMFVVLAVLSLVPAATRPGPNSELGVSLEEETIAQLRSKKAMDRAGLVRFVQPVAVAQATSTISSTATVQVVTPTLTTDATATPTVTVSIATEQELATTVPTSATLPAGTGTELEPSKADVTPTPEGPTDTITDAVVTNLPSELPSPTPQAADAEPSAITQAPSVQTQEEIPLEGTILTNRSEATVRFFVEGMTYTLAPLRSMGLDLPRVTGVLNLFNCDATVPETTDGCYWDPYLLERDGFYEITNGSTSPNTTHLLLQQAGSPPEDQVWVQNRTSTSQSIVYKNDVFELPPTTVMEFLAPPGVPAILYVPSCIAVDAQQACEWAPRTLDAGTYYAMVDVQTKGSMPGSQITTVDLRPVVSRSGETMAVVTQIACELAVPAINIRSGPGLQFSIVGKVRGTEEEPGRVVVVGRSPDQEWLSVADSIAEGGWVTSSPSFMQCSGDLTALPLVEVATLPEPAPSPDTIAEAPAAQPEPAQVGPQPQNEEPTLPAADGEDQPPTSEGEAPAEDGPAIPEGQALLLVNNGFQFEMRFTLDQRYRPLEGPSEYDLQPGESVSIVVYPGQVAFTVSSPWNGLSGNADLEIGEDESATLWLRFEPDPDGSSEWNLAWQ